MLLKPLFRLPQKMNLHFVRWFKLCFGLSIAALVATVALLFTQGLNFGIDFKGGTLMQVQTPTAVDAPELRTTLHHLGLGEIQLQNFGKNDELLIRFPEQAGGPEAQKVAADKVIAALPSGTKELRREQVGSTVSKELINSAIWAIVFTNLVIFAYVWFRFEWQFALGAVISLIHDVAVTLGVWSLFQLDFDLTIVAALLTILGYSINDTVVIYDRIRENLRKYKRMPLRDLLDLSVNETMSRTIMTVGTVLMALIALYFFGGEVIRGFTFAMLFGVLVGTYSSVYIAAPFLIMIGVKRDWSGVEKAQGKGKEKEARQSQGGNSASPAAKPLPEPEPAENLLHSIEEGGDERDVQSIGFSASIPLGASDKPAGPIQVGAPRKPPQSRSKRGKQRVGGGGRSKRRG
jgi:preprotein translocase subunit SecF